MKRKKTAALICAVLFFVVCVFSLFSAFASDVSWRYDGDEKTLYITGSGTMDNYTASSETPWSAHLSEMEHIVVEEGVSSLGDNAFAGASVLQDAEIASSVTKLGSYVFASCPLLQSLTLSTAIIDIADASFAYNGVDEKQNFVMYAQPGSYALSYAYKNDIAFVSEDVRTGVLHVSLQKGMMAYFPYTCHYNGQYRFYSVSKDDSLGYIYDSDKRQIATNDDHGSVTYNNSQGSTDFGLTTTLTKGERYYLGVKIFNPSLKARFDVYFEPVQFTVSGTLYAMNSPQGDASDILLSNAAINGNPTDNGAFTLTVNGVSETAAITCDGVTMEHTFTVEDGDDIVLTMMMCDLNQDGIVNAKDYALMQQTASRYTPLFENFMNYRY